MPRAPRVVLKFPGVNRSEAGLDRAKQAFEQEKARKAAVAQLKVFPNGLVIQFAICSGLVCYKSDPPFKGVLSDKPN